MRSILLAAFLMAAMVGISAAAPRWDVYANARFGYSICYPADLLKPQPEADNSDGRRFESPTGATLAVWGRYNTTNETLDELTADLVDTSASVSYRRATKSWSVVSGKKDGTIFYSKILFRKGDAATIRTFTLTYPESQASTFNPVSARLAQCFTAGKEN